MDRWTDGQQTNGLADGKMDGFMNDGQVARQMTHQFKRLTYTWTSMDGTVKQVGVRALGLSQRQTLKYFLQLLRGFMIFNKSLCFFTKQMKFSW
jgi:hypothetical protein